MNRRTILTLPTLALLGMAVSRSRALAQQGGTLQKQRSIVRNEYWALPGKAEEVYQWRIHACDVREKLGLRRGEVLRRDADAAVFNVAIDRGEIIPLRQGDSDAVPDVIWQIEYQSNADRISDLKATEGGEFGEVIKHMNTLTRRFQRSIWLPS